MTDTSKTLRTIGLEEHAWTPELWDLLDDGVDETIVMQNHRPGLNESLVDIGAGRIEAMDKTGVDVQVLSVPPPGTQNMELAKAVEVARAANDYLAEGVAANPDRFAAFATLPTPDPEAAAEELERAVTKLGMKGALLMPRTSGIFLDDERFRPVFEAAAALEVPLYIHPQMPPQAVRDAYFSGFSDPVNYALSAHGWGWHHDAGLTALRLILAGTFDRHPGLQVILGHWGEMLTAFLDRVDIMSVTATNLERRVGEYITDNFYVTAGGIYSEKMMQDAIAALGIDRVLFASDYPYVPAIPGAARGFLEQSSLSDEYKGKVAHGNADRLLSLPVSA